MSVFLTILAALQTGWQIGTISRAAGLTAYLLLSLALLSGMWSAAGLNTGPLGKKGLLAIHESVATTGILLGMGHGFILRFGTRPMRWVDILAPYISPRHPLVLVLGTISLYLLVFVSVTTDLRARLGYRQWRLLHRLSLPAWLLGLIHGVAIAPADAARPWVTAIYVIPAALTLLVGAIWVASLRRERGFKHAPAVVVDAVKYDALKHDSVQCDTVDRTGELHARSVGRG